MAVTLGGRSSIVRLMHWYEQPEYPTPGARQSHLRFTDRLQATMFLHDMADGPIAESALRTLLDEAIPGEISARSLACDVIGRLAELLVDGRVRAVRCERVFQALPGEASKREPRPEPEAKPAPPPPRQAGTTKPVPVPPQPMRAGTTKLDPVLSFYEVTLLDEMEFPIAGVVMELNTPGGIHRLETDGSGKVRVDNEPPGNGSVRIASAAQLASLLKDRATSPMRTTPLPDVRGDLVLLTPRRATTLVEFPDARPQKIMIVARTNVIAGSVSQAWGDLIPASEDSGPWTFANGVLNVLQMCSTGRGPTSVIVPRTLDPLEPPEPGPLPAPLPNPLWPAPDLYVVQPGDTLPDLAARYLGDADLADAIHHLNPVTLDLMPPDRLVPGTPLNMPAGTTPSWVQAAAPGGWPSAEPSQTRPWLNLDIDLFHEAFFDGKLEAIESLIARVFEDPPPPPPPDWPPPEGEAIQYVNEMLKLALSGIVDWPIVPEEPA